MGRGRLILVSVLVLVGACTSDETTGSTASAIDAEAPVSMEELVGRLAIIDGSGNVVVMSPDGSDEEPLTDDAGADTGYAQPSWSPDGESVAWAELSATAGMTIGDGESSFDLEMSQPPFYFYWAPDGQTVGVLHSGAPGLIEFELVDVGDESTMVVGTGAPFYLSWSPESDRLVVHTDGSRLDTLDLEGSSERFDDTSPSYAAPHWTEPGVFHVGARGLELQRLDGESGLLATTPGPVAFVANPQGTRVAAQAVGGGEPGGVGVVLEQAQALPLNSVVVVETATGEIVPVTERLSAGFFWSPDGRSLLIIEPTLEGGNAAILMWRDGEVRQLGVIAPHALFVRDVLQFFDQYAQSHRLWSPDSNAVVLPGEIEGETGIWVFRMNGEDPVMVTEGSWAMWSAA